MVGFKVAQETNFSFIDGETNDYPQWGEHQMFAGVFVLCSGFAPAFGILPHGVMGRFSDPCKIH